MMSVLPRIRLYWVFPNRQWTSEIVLLGGRMWTALHARDIEFSYFQTYYWIVALYHGNAVPGVWNHLCRPAISTVLSRASVAAVGKRGRKAVEGNRNGRESKQLKLRSCHTFNHRNSLYQSHILDFFVRFFLKTSLALLFGMEWWSWWWALVHTNKSIPMAVWIIAIHNR